MSHFDEYTYVHEKPVLQDRHRPAFASLTRDQAWRTYQRLVDANLLSKAIVPTDGPSLFLACRMANLDHGGVVLSLCREKDDIGVSAIETLVGKSIEMSRKVTLKSARGQPSGLQNKVAVRAQDSLIVRSVVPNPKKTTSTSHTRYNAWSAGATISECLARGLTRGDVAWDVGRNFVVLCTKEEWDAMQTPDQAAGQTTLPSAG